FLGRALPLLDAEGRVTQWFGTCTDIDDQKKAEDALRESRERLHAALDASGTGTFRWDIRDDVLEWDANLVGLSGLPPGREIRRLDDVLNLVHPHDRAAVIAEAERCSRQGQDFDLEFRVIWPDGSVHWLADKGKVFCGDDGDPLYLAGACVNITERHRAEEARKGSRERSARGLRSIRRGLWTSHLPPSKLHCNHPP